VTFDEKFRLEADRLSHFEHFYEVRSTGWRSPSNIALVKYWGKRDVQLPQNPSFSFALENSFTETLVHSAGIASSASAMSALALCLATIEQDLFESLKNEQAFFEKASFLSRLGSGSAARSVYGNYSVWGESGYIADSSDEIAVPYDHRIHPDFLPLGDAILLASSESKKVSSSMGHNLMKDHPYAAARYQQAHENLRKLINALESGDEQLFINIIENEALSLHALMMSSSEGYSLLNENTWEILNKIRKFRKDNDTFAAFTLDAGPNVHLVYKLKDRNKIVEFIEKELIEHCENGKWIDDKMGNGPRKIM
jgi:diphosphomevalonate decarboxylase